MSALAHTPHPTRFAYITLLEVDVYTPHTPVLKNCLALALAALTLLALPAPARAQDTNDEFLSLVQGAKVAYEASNFAEAIRLLQRANMVQPNSRLLINIAKSYENMNDCVRAMAYYKAYLRAPDVEDQLAKIAKDALKGVKKCKDFNDTLSGRILIRSTPAEADVTLDGQPVGPAPLELIALSPGPHKLRIEIKGHTPRDEDFNAESGKDTELSYKLEVIPPTVKEDPVKEDPVKDPVVVTPPKDEPSSLNIPAIAILGTGVAVFAVGAVYDLSVIPGTDEERDKVARDSQAFQDLTDERSTEATIAIASYVAGGILIAGGAGWLIYDMVAGGGSDKEDKKKSGAEDLVQDIRLTPIITPSTNGILFEARF